MVPNSMKQALLDVLAENYGIAGELQRLPGENLNFKVTTDEGAHFVLKVVDEHMPPAVADMESALLNHLSGSGFPLELPHIILNKDKKIETRIKIHTNDQLRARLIEFIDGIIWEDIADISQELLSDAGLLLAEFDQALSGFDHPAAHRDHRWNLANAGQHMDKAELIEDAEDRELVLWAFELWRQVSERLPDLPHQVIHGDANRSNFLVRDDSIVGLIDFGDCCYNPRICELATCLAYLMMDHDNPLAVAATVTSAYTEVVMLSEAELDVLFPLVCGPLAVSTCMATARMAEQPDHPNWFESLAPSLALLRKLREIGMGETDS